MSVEEFWLGPLQYEFFQHALVVGVAAGAIGALLSCWLVLIGWSLMGDAVSHAVLPGVVLAYLGGVPFAVGALIAGIGAVYAIGAVRDTTQVREDAAIGVVFTTLFAGGLVLISLSPSQTDLNHILFGNLLGLTRADVVQVVALSVLTAVALVARRRDLTLYAFDRDHAHMVGLSPRRLSALLLGAMALCVVVALQAVGVVLVVAMLITPGVTAFLLTERMSRMLWVAPVSAVGCSVAGLYASFHLDTSSGGTIVVAQGLLFAVVYLFGTRQGLVTGAVRRRQQARQLRRLEGAAP